MCRRGDDVRDSAHQALGHTARQLPRHEVKAAPNLVPGLGADFFLGSQFTQVPYKLLGSLLGVGHFKASAFFILEVELYPKGSEDATEWLGFVAISVEVKSEKIQKKGRAFLTGGRQRLGRQQSEIIVKRRPREQPEGLS